MTMNLHKSVCFCLLSHPNVASSVLSTPFKAGVWGPWLGEDDGMKKRQTHGHKHNEAGLRWGSLTAESQCVYWVKQR